MNKKKTIGIITLNRPEAFNSFVQKMAMDLQSKLEICKDNDKIRCIILTGHGKAFCAGQDLKEVMDPDGPEIEKIVNKHYNPIIKQIREIEKSIGIGKVVIRDEARKCCFDFTKCLEMLERSSSLFT